MKNEYYPFLSNQEKWYFEFESEGTKGKITKIVLFSKIKNNIWNLGFGDKTGDNWEDAVISNNGDLLKVMATIVAIGVEFSENWPDLIIHIQPVDDKRKMLYNALFKRNYLEINQNFEVKGFLKNRWVQYDTEKNFDQFRIRRKNTIFVKN
jgi:hypothetical protein